MVIGMGDATAWAEIGSFSEGDKFIQIFLLLGYLLQVVETQKERCLCPVGDIVLI